MQTMILVCQWTEGERVVRQFNHILLPDDLWDWWGYIGKTAEYMDHRFLKEIGYVAKDREWSVE